MEQNTLLVHLLVEQWRNGKLTASQAATAKPVKVAAVAPPPPPPRTARTGLLIESTSTESDSVLQKQLTDARANVKKLTLQVQELTEANVQLTKKLADAASKEKLVQITTISTSNAVRTRLHWPRATINCSYEEGSQIVKGTEQCSFYCSCTFKCSCALHTRRYCNVLNSMCVQQKQQEGTQAATIAELREQIEDLQGRLDTALEERGEFEQQVIALNESTARYKTELVRMQADTAGKNRASVEVLYYTSLHCSLSVVGCSSLHLLASSH